MTLAETIYEQVKGLPEPLAREVLDFVEFLGERTARGQWADLRAAQKTGLRSVWDHPDEAVWDNV
jgi:hypothetical protein